MKKLDYYRRILCTGIAFATFGIGGPVISLLVIPIINLRYSDPVVRGRKVRFLVHKCFGAFIWWMQTLRVVDFQFKNLEKISEDAGTMVLANHPSLIDVVALISVYPNANCVVKRALWENPLTRGVVSSAGYIPSDGGLSVLEDCGGAIKNGDTLILFPEGTRTVPGVKPKIKRGAAQIALRLGCPVRMVKISIEPTTLTKAESWYQVPPKKALFSMEIADKVCPQSFAGYRKSMHIPAKALTSEISQKLWEI